MQVKMVLWGNFILSMSMKPLRCMGQPCDPTKIMMLQTGFHLKYYDELANVLNSVSIKEKTM